MAEETQQQQTQQGQASTGEGSTQQTGQTGVEGAGQQQAQQAAPTKVGTADHIGLTREQLKDIVKTSVSEVSKPQETPEQMVERFNKSFNVYQFQADRLMKLGYSQEQIAEIIPVYEDMRDGLVKQAVTMSNYQLALLRQELEAKFAPALTVAQQHQEAQLVNEFMGQNPDLKGFEPLLEQIKAKYQANGFPFKGATMAERKKEIFTAIAEEAKSIIASVRGNGGSAAGAGAAGGQQGQQSQRMSTVTAGGQGGAGGGGSPDGGKKVSATAKAIFS